MKRFPAAVVVLTLLGACAPVVQPDVRFTAPPLTPMPSQSPVGDAAQPATRLPDIILPPLDDDGIAVRLSSISGRPTVINAWASWCGPCRKELPFLGRAAKAYDGRVDFLGVNVADPDTHAAQTLVRETGATFVHVVDLHSRTRVPLRYTGGLPTTVFVDAQGRIVGEERTWFRSYAELTAAIQRHLGVAS